MKPGKWSCIYSGIETEKGGNDVIIVRHLMCAYNVDWSVQKKFYWATLMSKYYLYVEECDLDIHRACNIIHVWIVL